MSAARRRWPEGASAASGQLQLRAVHSTKHEARVGTRHPVVVAAVDLVGVDQAQPRLGADVPLHPEQVVDRVIFAAGRAGRSSTAMRSARSVPNALPVSLAAATG